MYTIKKAICNSYTMYARDLTDIYTQSPRAEGVYISEITSTHGITNMCHLFVYILCGDVLKFHIHKGNILSVV